MILGISSSGRSNGVTAKAVKKILEATGEEYEYISLAGKNIRGCTGCLGCALDNLCKVKDDWNEIGEKMKKSDAIVFGGTNYYGALNSLGQATLERTFSFRHMERFKLAGKLGVIVSCGYDPKNNPVADYIKRLMTSNMMPIIGTVETSGYSQCYTCPPNKDCLIGNVFKDHGFIDVLEKKHFPKHFDEQEEANIEAIKTGKILGSILKARSKNK